jgi:hypothetical protein
LTVIHHDSGCHAAWPVMVNVGVTGLRGERQEAHELISQQERADARSR